MQTLKMLTVLAIAYLRRLRSVVMTLTHKDYGQTTVVLYQSMTA